MAQRLISERCREIEIQISRSAASNGFNAAPAPANAFVQTPFGYESQQQLGYMHGIQVCPLPCGGEVVRW